MSTLKGPRIELKMLLPTDENVKRVLAVIDKNRSHLHTFLPAYSQMQYEDLKHNLCGGENNHSYFMFKDNAIIGQIRVYKEGNSRDVVYWVDKDNIGHGYAGEALALIEKEEFSKGCQAINLFVFCDNVSSVRVVEKAGYVLDKQGYHKTMERYLDLQNNRPVCVCPALLKKTPAVREVIHE